MKKTALAPAKVILSGEHAVVYGAPALAMAANRVAITEIDAQSKAGVCFFVPTVNYERQYGWQELLLFKKNIDEKYQDFLQNKISITKVLDSPLDIVVYGFVKTLLFCQSALSASDGIKITVTTDIPIGCGMGASAAVIISLLRAIESFFDLKLSIENFYTLGREIENLQHGFSSGVDIYLAIHGGCVRFSSTEIMQRATPKWPMFLVNTGHPLTTTGECVKHAANFFQTNTKLTADFTAVTEQLDLALLKDNFELAKLAVLRNHQLLCGLEVVPFVVRRFIEEIEAEGSVAKICGAGAVRGDQAGIVLVLGDCSKLESLVKKFNYDFLGKLTVYEK